MTKYVHFLIRRFPCEVRVRATPLLPCRRHGKKRNGKDIADDEPGTPTEETAPPTPAATPAPPTPGAVKKENGKKSNKSQSKQVRFLSLIHRHSFPSIDLESDKSNEKISFCSVFSNSRQAQVIRCHEPKRQAQPAP